MSAGQVWQRPNGLRWIEVQTPGMDGSGWRLMVPVLEPADAPVAPPLVVTVSAGHARVHLIRSVPEGDLGDPVGELDRTDVDTIQRAARALLGGPA